MADTVPLGTPEVGHLAHFTAGAWGPAPGPPLSPLATLPRVGCQAWPSHALQPEVMVGEGRAAQLTCPDQGVGRAWGGAPGPGVLDPAFWSGLEPAGEWTRTVQALEGQACGPCRTWLGLGGLSFPMEQQMSPELSAALGLQPRGACPEALS